MAHNDIGRVDISLVKDLALALDFTIVVGIRASRGFVSELFHSVEVHRDCFLVRGIPYLSPSNFFTFSCGDFIGQVGDGALVEGSHVVVGSTVLDGSASSEGT